MHEIKLQYVDKDDYRITLDLLKQIEDDTGEQGAVVVNKALRGYIR